LLALCVAVAGHAAETQGQKNPEKEEEFLKTRPLVGDPLPDVMVYRADGQPLRTSDLRGHYSVLTFGCLT
jgi:hypothetical protein